MDAADRSEKLLALILLQYLKTAPQRDKALNLSLAGLTNTEIADLLQTNAATVAQALYEARRKPAAKAKRPKAPKK